PLQRVQMKAGDAYIVDGPGFVELAQNRAHLVEQVGSNPAGIVLFKEPLQALMPKADYHIALYRGSLHASTASYSRYENLRRASRNRRRSAMYPLPCPVNKRSNGNRPVR